MNRRGFTTGDFDPSFALDSKFIRLRQVTDQLTYFACAGVWWHFLGATWRAGQRVTIAREMSEVGPELVGPLRTAGLIDSEGRIPRGSFKGWIGSAIERRDAARDRQWKHRHPDELVSDRVTNGHGTSQPRSLSRVTNAMSPQVRSGDGRDSLPKTDEREKEDRASHNGKDLDQFVRVSQFVSTLTGQDRALASPGSRLSERALELCRSFGEERAMEAMRDVASLTDHPDARQIILGANDKLRPLLSFKNAAPIDREAADAKAQIAAARAAANGGRSS
jgi:hypothetical protein